LNFAHAIHKKDISIINFTSWPAPRYNMRNCGRRASSYVRPHS